jgi:hypothetical protein
VRRLLVITASLALIGAGLLVGARSAGALDLMVTTTVDGGAGSLRDAIDQVNGTAGPNSITLGIGEVYQLDVCPAGATEDANADGDLDIFDTEVTVHGNGSTIEQTCDGERVLHVVDADVDLLDLELTGGDTTTVGGGLFVFDGSGTSDVLVSGVTVAGNHADGNGGGINSGGGDTVIEIVNSTLTGNDANAGGGIFIGFPSVANLRFVTIADNSSVTGIGSNLNGGSGGTILATVVADPNGGDNCSGTPASEGYNYADGICPFAGGNPTDENDGGPALLGTLADNGGPTRTMLPAATSPLLDQVPSDPTACDLAPVDQRGVTRPQGPLCDIGAVEREVVEPGPTPEPGPAAPVTLQPTFTG